MEGADEASEGRREEGKPGHVQVLDAGLLSGETAHGARVLRPSEPPLCLRMEA